MAAKHVHRVRPHYLRALASDAESALELIVRDLVSTGAATRAEAESLIRNWADEHLNHLAESGYEVFAPEAALWVAEAVQEDLIEGHSVDPPMIVWPVCPDHPNHPLWLRSKGEDDHTVDSADWDDPAWTCISTGRVVAELGGL